MLAVLYNALNIPIQLAYEQLWVPKEIWFYLLDYSLDAVFIIDFWICSRTAFMEKGIMKTSIADTR